MILKTKNFQEAANKILMAVGIDKAAANLELAAKDTALYLRVTNREYYVAVRFELETPSDFRAVVDANLFLNLISGINTEEFELKINDTNVVVKAGKSSYKLAMIYENDKLMKLPIIKLDKEQVTVDMPISNDILMSILNVNGKEIQKAKSSMLTNYNVTTTLMKLVALRSPPVPVLMPLHLKSLLNCFLLIKS